MRKRLTTRALAAITVAAALGLGACSSGESVDEEEVQSAQSDAADSQEAPAPPVDRDPDFPLPGIAGEFDEVPEMTPVDEEPPDQITSKVLEATDKDGAVVGLNDLVTVNYAGYLWDGKPFDSSFSRGSPTSFGLNSVIQGWKYGLADTQVGDRVLLIVPPEYGYGDSDNGDIPPNSTLVFVVDILDAIGEDVSALLDADPTGAELPEGLLVEGELGEAPTIAFEDVGEGPTEEQTIVLAEGTGPVVTAADTVIYHYSGAYWGADNGATDTWASGPEVADAANSPFLGEKVGSRIALVFPGQGDAQPPMVMVVDILGAKQE